jgi:cell division protein FtsB
MEKNNEIELILTSMANQVGNLSLERANLSAAVQILSKENEELKKQVDNLKTPKPEIIDKKKKQ